MRLSCFTLAALLLLLSLGCGKKTDPTPAAKAEPTRPGSTVTPGSPKGGNSAPVTVSDEQAAQGTWKAIMVVEPSGDVPAGALEDVEIVVSGNKVTVRSLSRKRPDQVLEFKLDSTKTPKQVDFIEAGEVRASPATPGGKPRKEQYLGIYKQEGDTLILASAIESGPPGYRPKEFKAEMAPLNDPAVKQHFIVVLMHLQKKK